LNLDGEQIGWILEPADLKFLAIKRAGLDRASVVVRDELAILIAATDPHALVWKRIGPRLVAGCDQVTRTAVERDMEFRIGKARALNDWFKITG
jgi:hypothetical protein